MILSRPYIWVFIFVFSLISAVTGLVMLGRKGMEGPGLEAVSLEDTVQRINDLHLTRFRGEEIEWEIKAKSSIILNGEEDTSVKDVNITYFPQGGTPIEITAEKGRYNVGANTFFVEKVEREVDVKIGQGFIIKGNGFEWSGDKRRIYGPGKVHVTGERFILEGEGLEASLDSGIYKIGKNIKAVIQE